MCRRESLQGRSGLHSTEVWWVCAGLLEHMRKLPSSRGSSLEGYKRRLVSALGEHSKMPQLLAFAMRRSVRRLRLHAHIKRDAYLDRFCRHVVRRASRRLVPYRGHAHLCAAALLCCSVALHQCLHSCALLWILPAIRLWPCILQTLRMHAW